MKKSIYSQLVCLIIALGLGLGIAQAQESNVEIVTTYTPEVASATKLLAPTSIADDPRIDPDIAYQVPPSLWQISLDAHNFNPARASYWDYISYKRLFAKVAAGYPLATDGRIRYTLQTPKVGYLGIGLDHTADLAARTSQFASRTIGESFSMHNGASVGGGLFVGNYLLEGAIKYDNDIYNSYAAEAPERLVFHDASVGVKFGDEFVDLTHLNFSLEAHAGLWSHRLPMITDELESAQMYNAGGRALLARDFSGNTVTLELEGDAWGGNRPELSLGGGVGYARKFGFVHLEAGLKYLYDKVKMQDKASHYLLPRAKVLFDLNKVSFVPYIEISSEVKHNTLEALYEANPYIWFDSNRLAIARLSNSLDYNLSLGFNGTLFSSRLAYHVYAGASFMRDHLFWCATDPGLYSVTTGNNARIFVGVGAEATPIAGLKLDLDFLYNFDNASAMYLLSEPNMRGNISAEYTLRKWKFYVGGELLGARSCSVIREGVLSQYDMPLAFDLGAGLSYRINRHIELYADGKNLLNSKIYDFVDYYRPGAGFMLGIKMDF